MSGFCVVTNWSLIAVLELCVKIQDDEEWRVIDKRLEPEGTRVIRFTQTPVES